MNPVILDTIGGLLQVGANLIPGAAAADSTVSLVVTLVEEAIKEEPAIETALRSVFSKSDPTAADWAAARAAVVAIPEPIVETTGSGVASAPPPVTPQPVVVTP